MAKKAKETLFGSESGDSAQGPVECLGIKFPNDEARRAHFTEKLREKLKDPAFLARSTKFLRASLKGWADAVKDPAGAAKIVVAADPSGSATVKVQQRQMENVAKLITTAGTPKLGYLEPVAYERTVKVLLAAGSSPVIKKDPGKAAYSHVVWEAATKK